MVRKLPRAVLAWIVVVGLITSIFRPVDTAAASERAVRYQYDVHGNVSVRTDPTGARTEYTYDAQQQLTRIAYAGGSSITFEYDALGRPTAMADALGRSSYTYDIHSRLKQIKDALGKDLTYAYEPRGLPTTLTGPGTNIALKWDADRRLTNVTDGSETTSYAYDPAGRVVQRVLPNGVTTAYEYDGAGRLTAIRHADARKTPLLTLTYVLDAAGRRTSLARTDGNGTPATTSFRFDALGQLTEVTYPNGEVVSYAYDAVGNRTLMRSSVRGETSYAYDSLDQLMQVAGPDGSVRFRYDANGNLVERRSGNQVITYQWDPEQRLLGVNDGTTEVRFAYDGTGRRLKKLVGGRETRYLQHGIMLPQVLSAQTGGETVRSVMGLTRVGERGQQGTTFYLEDGLGSVVGLTDAAGRLTGTVEYDAFGAIRTPPTTAPSFGYTGEQLDETGLLFLRARYYDPTLGRFISRDPLPPDLARPRTLNRYAYVENNPISFVDPLGLQAGPPPPPPPLPSNSSRNSLDPRQIPATFPSRPEFQIYPSTSQRYYETSPNWILDTKYDLEHKPNIGSYRELTGRWPSQWTDRGQITFISSTTFETSTDRFGVYGPDRKVNWPSMLLHGVFDWAPYKAEQVGNRLLDRIGNWFGGTGNERSRLPSPTGGPPSRMERPSSRTGGPSWTELSRSSSTYNPPPPGGGGGGATVGGVSLDKAATLLHELDDVVGATVDPATGQLVLIGRRGTDEERLRLPPMSLDDLVVAVRAVYNGENPGVTMVPMDPNGATTGNTTQYVEYFGQTQDTRFGWLMFEADRYLKGLSAGRDTLTGAAVNPNVPGFKSEAQLVLDAGVTDLPWHRNWFVPDEIVVRRADDGSMVFEKATIKLESRFIQFRNGQPFDVPGSSPVVDEFGRLVTQHYDALSREKPELQELVRLAKVVAIVRWLRDTGVPLDPTWLARHEVASTPTPLQTPGVIAQLHSGSATVKSFGGVDLSTGNDYRPDNGPAAVLRDKTLGSRPPSAPLRWGFEHDGQQLVAIAFHVAPTEIVGGYTRTETDLSIQTAGGLVVEHTRQYSSVDQLPGPLGRGWSFGVPTLAVKRVGAPGDPRRYSTHVQLLSANGGVEADLSLTEDGLFRPTDLSSPYSALGATRQDFGKLGTLGGVELQPSSPGQPITARDQQGRRGQAPALTLMRNDDTALDFDETGRLVALRDRSGPRLRYSYVDGRLAGIVDDGGRGLRFVYGTGGRLDSVEASDGRAVRYAYDGNGLLVGVSDAAGAGVVRYAYDGDGRLTKIMDGAGQAILENAYDGLGRVIESRSSAESAWRSAYDPAKGEVRLTNDATGVSIVREYDAQKRLIRERDSTGASIGYEYDGDGRLTRIVDAGGNATTIAYSADGFPSEIVSPLGERTRLLNHDQLGTPTAVVDPLGQLALLETNARGQVTKLAQGLRLADASATGGGYLAVDPAVVELTYDAGGNLEAVKDPAGFTTRLVYDQLGNVVEAHAPGGGVTRQAFDGQGRLTALEDPTRNRADFDYHADGSLAAVRTAAGASRFTYAAGRLATSVDPLGHTTAYDYHQDGRLSAVAEADGSRTSYEYDGAGNLRALVDRAGRRTTFEYDPVGRLIAESHVVIPWTVAEPAPAPPSRPGGDPPPPINADQPSTSRPGGGGDPPATPIPPPVPVPVPVPASPTLESASPLVYVGLGLLTVIVVGLVLALSPMSPFRRRPSRR